MYKSRPDGFTLIELLVVVAIIGVLIALLVPAVQAAREQARILACQNHLKQIGLATASHVEAHGFFPTGGWPSSPALAGDPDRGFNRRQPGGWAYNLLPYLELGHIHDLGAGETGEAKRLLLGQAAATPVALYHCPSRRPAIQYPSYPSPLENAELPADRSGRKVVATTDYAACWGDRYHPPRTGVCYGGSEVEPAQITDGLSHTYLIGEKYMNPDWYFSGVYDLGHRSWDHGAMFETHRYTGANGDIIDPEFGFGLTPLQDRAGLYNGAVFGSAHSGGCNMVFCDGAVRTPPYTIDAEIHRRLGNRKDGLVVDASQY